MNQGHGRVYDSSFEKRSRFYAAESDAQDQQLGAWDCRDVSTATPIPTATPTPEDASDSGPLSVVRVHEDAAGNDHENDEDVVFENTGDTELDLSGLTVSDEADHTYTFPNGFSLSPGAQVTLYTGSGEDTQTELYWGSDAAIWNNDGDTMYVHTDDGKQVINYPY